LVLRGWFQYNWRLDQGINGIKYVKNDPKQGVVITIENFGKNASKFRRKTKSGKITSYFACRSMAKNKVWSSSTIRLEEITSIRSRPCFTG
jgi:hypothetical protein